MLAADKIGYVLAENGICLCEANAPRELLSQAFDEAEALWRGGAFGPPMRAVDDLGQIEAQAWKEVVFQDEDRVVWINPEDRRACPSSSPRCIGLVL